MNRVVVTGDIHGCTRVIVDLANKLNLKDKEDTVVVLGDVGINFYRDIRDEMAKKALSHIAPTIFCIRGNHEIRPENISSYRKKNWKEGEVYYEENYPNIVFAKDGQIFNFNGKRVLIAGGAYSLDKKNRRANLDWWSDEQLSYDEKTNILIAAGNNHIDAVFSHTCPWSKKPTQEPFFINPIEEATIDRSTEYFLDTLYSLLGTSAVWYCGHWHMDKVIDNVNFLYHTYIEL